MSVLMSVKSALWHHWYKEQLCATALGDYKWFQLSWRLCSPRFLSLVKMLKKKGEMCSSLIKYVSAIYRKKTVQMVAMILVQMPQYQLSNFCLRVRFYLFHHPNQTGSGSPGWMGEIDCWPEIKNNDLIGKDLRGTRRWSEIWGPRRCTLWHKPVDSWRESLSNLMHVCESRRQHVGRKSQKITFKAARDRSSPRSCASLKHSNKMVWNMDLLLHTSVGTP